jgi:hypothetical protein
VLERETRIYPLLSAVGLRDGAYWLSQYIFGFVMYLMVVTVFLATGFAFQVHTLTRYKTFYFHNADACAGAIFHTE